jgi:hypothetical protein
MSAIGKGDWVQCIDASPDYWGDPVSLVVSAVYCVRAIQPYECDRVAPPGHEGLPSILLVGVFEGPDGDDGFRPDRFRPLGGNAKTLTAPPQRVTEDA